MTNNLINNDSIVAILDTKGNFIEASKNYKVVAEIDDISQKNHFEMFSKEPENQIAFKQVVETGIPHLIQSYGIEINGLSNKCGEKGNWVLVPSFGEDKKVDKVIISYVHVNEDSLRKSLKVDEDHLTSLLNRKGIERKIKELMDNDKNFTVLFIDLNKFKIVNDTYGHEIGDGLLKAIGKRIRSCIREHDAVGRLGGDEFVVVISSIKEEVVCSVVDRINDKFKREFVINDIILKSSASIGMARYPIDALTMEDILSHSDKRMYEQKNAELKENKSKIK